MERLIPKKTGTYADSLEAIGLASLLEELGYRGVTIRDTGPEFVVHTPNGLTPDEWVQPEPGYPYIWERGKEPHKPKFQWLLDYQDGKAKTDVWRKFQKAEKKSRGRAKTALQDQELETPPEPPREYPAAAIVASMRKGWDGDRELALWLREHPVEAMAWIQQRLGLSAATSQQPDISNTQLLNPISGKGISAPKTEWRSPGSIPGALIEPFAEWMKLRGLWAGMLLFRADDDFKFFVIEPTAISLGALKIVRNELDGLRLWGGVKLDIEAILRCTEILIRRSDVLQPADGPRISLRSLTPRSVIGGLRQAFFKSLGTAAALMNDAILPLPEWYAIETREDANDCLEIIVEAIGTQAGGIRTAGCLGSLDEKHSDDGRILQQYRQWLLSGELNELLDFHHQFAVHQMKRLAADEWVKGFSTHVLDTLLVKSYSKRKPMIKEIIQDEGFKSLARAIRDSTVHAMRKKRAEPSRGRLENRDVHFGLAQRWKQKIKAGDKEFASELGEFVQVQNWEVIDRLKGKGHVVSTTDLDSVLNLVETHHAELVGSLLLAYGYARGPKVKDGKQDAVAAAN